jgi:Activator of Hsp90 ATPase homolog 1-like protein
VSDGHCEARFTRRYNAPIAQVWQALTDPASVARWLAPPAGVEVVRSERERFLELDWTPQGEPPSVVRIELSAEGERTLLVLDHRRIDAALGMRYMRDWTRALNRLEGSL